MYAIIRSGGKQAKVREGDVIDVERLHAEGEVTFTPLLVVGEDGTAISDRDTLSKALVHARVVGEHRGDKLEVFKYKAKTGYRRRQGHRQTYTTIEIVSIEAPGVTKKKAAASTKKGAAKPAAAAEDTAAEDTAAEDAAAEDTAAVEATAADDTAAAEDTAAEDTAAEEAAAEAGTAGKAKDAAGAKGSAKGAGAKKATEEAEDDASGARGAKAAATDENGDPHPSKDD